MLDGLFEIAKADGVLHPAESQFLERVAEIFGFAPNEFRRIRASHFAPELTDPYVILGLSYVAGEDEIRQTYRRLVKENHPDSLMARGVPEEFIKLANDKLAAINAEGLLSDDDWAALNAADAIVFGSPTYMGNVSWQFKRFADATSKAWFTRAWQDKLFAGFTNALMPLQIGAEQA